MIKIKKQKQQEAVDFVKGCYKNSLEFQRPLFQRYNDYYSIYRAVRDNGKQSYAGRANMFIPYVFGIIETILPRLIGAKPKIEAIPREPNDIDSAKRNTQIFDYQWDKMEMKKKLKTWVRTSMIYGTGFLKLYWSFKGDEDYIEQDQAEAEVLDLFDCFYDPNACDVQEGYFIQRAERNLKSLRANSNYDIPKQLEAHVKADEYKIQRDAILGLSKSTNKYNKDIQVLEYWGMYDLGNGEEECLLVIADDYLIRAEPNPYEHKRHPFIRMVDIDVPFSMTGIGEVEMNESLQYELNDIRNQRMDNVSLILNRMFLVKKTGGVEEDELVSQAGNTIHVDDMDAVQVLSTPDVTSSSYNEEATVKEDMKWTSGANDFVAGGSEKGATTTATGISLLQEAGNARFKYKLDNIEDSLIQFGKQLLSLNQQFMDTETKIRIVGEQEIYDTISPEEIKGDFDVTVEAGSTQPMNKSVRRAEARELLQAVVPFAQSGLDIKYFIKYLLKTYDLADIEKAFPQEQIIPGAQGPQGAGLTPSVGTQAIGGMANPQAPMLQ